MMQKTTEAKGHQTVFLTEAVDALVLKEDAVVVDATGGVGGHSARILESLGADGTLIIIDADPSVVSALKEKFSTPAKATPTIHIILGNFRHITTLAGSVGIGRVDAVLADLGWNSEQFRESGRGFSFQHDEPLLMTYGSPATYPFVARDIVNDWKEEQIADVLYAYADERYARRIAKGIVDARKKTPIETTRDLLTIIEKAVPVRYRHGRLHPATKTFQALRIAVNDELDALRDFIEGSIALLAPQGRLAIVTFHSIEDRIVKQLFKAYEDDGIGERVTKKPLVPTREESLANPRARSAKLRIFHML